MRLLFILLAFIAGCDSSSSSPVPSNPDNYVNPDTFVYRPVTEEDLTHVTSTWAVRDLAPKDVELIYQEDQETYSVAIASHTVAGKLHHVAIISPNPLPSEPIPVVIHTSGLNQRDPRVYVQYYIDNYPQPHPLASFIQIIPSFRGQTLLHKDQFLTSRGNFCDAWDGPTDDTIASLNVVASLMPEGNYEKVLVAGGSRGATVALILAARDARVNTVLATASPVDFYRTQIRDLFGDQYKCHFFTHKTEEEARFTMLTASPVYFQPKPETENVFLFHGEFDETVALWNAEEMNDHLYGLGVPVSTTIYPAGHGSIYNLPEYKADFESAIEQFLLNIQQ